MDDDFDNWLAGRKDGHPAGDVDFAPGTAVGDYRIVARLGHGGFADVYRASGKNGEEVAIKVLHKQDEKSRARFVRESEILAQIRHRNMPRLLSFGSCGDRPYMVTELLTDCELPGTDRKIAKFLRQVMSATEELHRHGFIHRDIKPANILSRDDGTPVLIDFGLASPISAAKREKDGLSVEGGNRLAVGTVGYSAPEQFSGLPAGKEADVHAIGALIDACYHGKMPRCWRRIYLSATASNPRSRYQTVQGLRTAVNMRHWRKILVSVLIAILAGAIAFQQIAKARNHTADAVEYGAVFTSAEPQSIDLAPEDAPKTNAQYSVRCQVFFKSNSLPIPLSGDVKAYVGDTLNSWMKAYIDDEYRGKSYEDLLEDLKGEDFAKELKEQLEDNVAEIESLLEGIEIGDYDAEDLKDLLPDYVEGQVSVMVLREWFDISIVTVTVDPEGDLMEDMERRRKIP